MASWVEELEEVACGALLWHTIPAMISHSGTPCSQGLARAGRPTYLALFIVSLCALLYEVLLTRIFSVTMFYHFAFMAISIALFGGTVGAMLVYAFPRLFSREHAPNLLPFLSLLFSVSMTATFIIHLRIPVNPNPTRALAKFGVLGATYVLISVPFLFSGMTICLSLTKFGRHVGRIYAADLTGAAAGCMGVIGLLKFVDAPTAVVIVSAFASVAAVLFSLPIASRGTKWVTGSAALVLTVFASANVVFERTGSPLIHLVWVKGHRESPPLYERWNSFSRITVHGAPSQQTRPHPVGLSPACPPNALVTQLLMTIDATAGTPITKFEGDIESLVHLRYHVTNIVHHVRPGARVLVVGSGGGRDILSALTFSQPSVMGIEINPDILATLNETLGDFSGHLDMYPGVTFVNEEARSYICRQQQEFDIIQVSFIDTWAATAAGAFVFTENGLYTTEAWRIFLDRLSPRGILSFSRWYFPDMPIEMYRLVSLASETLFREGIENPRAHLFLARCMRHRGMGTLLVSRQPLSCKDLAKLNAVCQKLHFEVVLTPSVSLDPVYEAITSKSEHVNFLKHFPVNVTAPTDDKPFFFHMLRLNRLLDEQPVNGGLVHFNVDAMTTLGALIVIVIVLAALCIALPLGLVVKRGDFKGALPLLAFFVAIGLGFMCIEVALLQRMTIFLGHPVYGLSVVLFSLLLAAGSGSFSTRGFGEESFRRIGIVSLALLLCALVFSGIATPWIIHSFERSTTPLRILVAVITILPVGFLMGMAFPLGMGVASGLQERLRPCFVGVNGAMSICASVLSVAIAMSLGISALFWLGAACYVAAFFAFVRSDNILAHSQKLRR